jgi:CRP/FNR family transcriptional regulator, cyclic AMP receptor protein
MATSIPPAGAARSMAEFPLYQSLTTEEIAELNALLEDVSYNDGQTIFHQNDPGDAAYIIREGEVRIWTHDEDAREVTLARLGPHDFFGELAVLDGGPRSASATATEYTVVGRLSKERMQEFLLAHPQASLVMIQEIGRRLRQTNQLVSQRVTRNINVEMDEKMTIGQRVADKVASFGGSWTFIFIYSGFLLVWIAVNTFVLSRMGEAAQGGRQFDPYPYILLNLMLSMTAALQAPIIMMSQNRSGEKDRLAAENDFRVNLKSELMLEELTRRMDRLQNDQIEEVLLLTRHLKEHAPPSAAAADNGAPPTGAT